MGTWDLGPFDNDTAADFSGSLDSAAEQEREAVVRRAFTSAIESEDFLDDYEGSHAIASAALVAAQCPGGVPVTTAYGPKQPLPVFSTELRTLAAQALDRVVAANSEIAELWDETGEGETWRRSIAELRAVLAPAQ